MHCSWVKLFCAALLPLTAVSPLSASLSCLSEGWLFSSDPTQLAAFHLKQKQHLNQHRKLVASMCFQNIRQGLNHVQNNYQSCWRKQCCRSAWVQKTQLQGHKLAQVLNKLWMYTFFSKQQKKRWELIALTCQCDWRACQMSCKLQSLSSARSTHVQTTSDAWVGHLVHQFYASIVHTRYTCA